MAFTPKTSDRVAGVLLGLAAGDRNGGPTLMGKLMKKETASQPVAIPRTASVPYMRQL